jgi:hypothetical protein
LHSTRLTAGADVGTNSNRSRRTDPERKKDVSNKPARQRRKPIPDGDLGREHNQREKRKTISREGLGIILYVPLIPHGRPQIF